MSKPPQPEETPDLDPDFTPPEAVELDHARGTMMTEKESWERVIEGLKLSADGANQLARHIERDQWENLARTLDKVRRAMIQLGGFDRPSDGTNPATHSGSSKITMSEAYRRLVGGLEQASGGAQQIALGQRMDLRWKHYANVIDEIKDKARTMALKQSPLLVQASMMMPGSGRLQ